MSPGSIVLLAHEIAAGPFEKYFDQAGAFAVVINNQDASLFSDRRPGDCIDLRLIEPINATQRWILTNDVRSIHTESVRVFDDLDYTRYFQIYSVPHRPEHHSLSIDLLRGHWQLNRRRSVSHTREDQTALGSSKAIISSNFDAAVIGVETIQRSAVREIDVWPLSAIINGLVLLQALHEVRLTRSTGSALVIFLPVCRAAFRVDLRFQIMNFDFSFFLFR